MLTLVSLSCDQAIRGERARFLQYWQAMSKAAATERAANAIHDSVNQIWFWPEVKLSYVENQKAASRRIKELLTKRFGYPRRILSRYRGTRAVTSQHLQKVHHWQNASDADIANHLRDSRIFVRQLVSILDVCIDSHTSRLACAQFRHHCHCRDSRSQTFIREPLSTFVSGYLEVVERLATGIRGSRRPRVEQASVPFMLTPCSTPDGDGSARLAALLTELRGGRLHHSLMFHLWPQVLKVDCLPHHRRRLDYVGRVEYLEHDLGEMLQAHSTAVSSTLDPTYARRLAVYSATLLNESDGANNRSKKPSSLSSSSATAARHCRSVNINNLSQRDKHTVCELLALDMECLGRAYLPPKIDPKICV
jgi:hypothetical protein